MRLSEAIRLGAMLKPQRFGSLGWANSTCALGAAFDAVGGLADACGDLMAFAERQGWTLAYRTMDCPVCGKQDAKPTIAHLNDNHRWTRERIADWVETIEPSEQPTPTLTDQSLALPERH